MMTEQQSQQLQPFKTGVNGAFAATPNGGKVFIDAAMSLRGAYLVLFLV